MLVKDVMQFRMVSISPDATLGAAAEAMLTQGVDTLMVMDGERWLGVMGLRDLFTAPSRPAMEVV